MEKINIAELLKDCPSGMELDCAICENVYFDKVDSDLIKCFIKNDVYEKIYFYRDGTHISAQNAKCVIFPKGKTTWEGFVPPCKFKDGDIIFTHADCTKITWISIFEENRNGGVATYVDYCNEGKDFYTYLDDKGLLCMKEDIIRQRLATEEEKEKLFKAIKDNGFRWNAETKTLEKKKKEYPKTYEECCEVLGYSGNYNMILTTDVDNKLFNALYKLKVRRDAYWKIYGKEMGLGKSWKPDFDNDNEYKYGIFRLRNIIYKDATCINPRLLVFPTEEMRDAFYENFKDLIEQCKELL